MWANLISDEYSLKELHKSAKNENNKHFFCNFQLFLLHMVHHSNVPEVSHSHEGFPVTYLTLVHSCMVL